MEHRMTGFANKFKMIITLVLFPFRTLLARLGIRLDVAGVVNRYYREAFRRVPVSERAVILPHCLTGDKCGARFSKDEGVICRKCGRCRCGEIRSLCGEKGWQFYISPSANFTRRLAVRKNIRAAIGAACEYEIERGIKSTRITGRGVHIDERRLTPQMIVADRYDCMHNNIDWEKLRGMITAGDN